MHNKFLFICACTLNLSDFQQYFIQIGQHFAFLCLFYIKEYLHNIHKKKSAGDLFSPEKSAPKNYLNISILLFSPVLLGPDDDDDTTQVRDSELCFNMRRVCFIHCAAAYKIWADISLISNVQIDLHIIFFCVLEKIRCVCVCVRGLLTDFLIAQHRRLACVRVQWTVNNARLDI